MFDLPALAVAGTAIVKEPVEAEAAEPGCKHFWRAKPTTRFGLVECEKCGANERFGIVLDEMLISMQEEKGISRA